MMKKFFSLLLFMAVTTGICKAQVAVFKSGSTASATPRYRIPAIIKNKDGNLVAFSDNRHGYGDIGNGQIDIYGNVSKDNGLTWGGEYTVAAGSSKTGFDNAHGDVAVVCDRESGRMLMMCASGSVGYGSSAAKIGSGWFYYQYSLNVDNAIRVGCSYSSDNGLTWTKPTDVTSSIYGIWGKANSSTYENIPVKKLFFTSGKICQSSKIKVGSYYRIYAALCTDAGSLVVYSDDFGGTWNALGGTSARPASGGDEAKVEELPDGNVLLCCRVSGSTGRYFNIFKYTDANNAKGTWSMAVRSGASNITGETYAASCNGDIMIVPAKRDGKDIYVVLLSAAMSSSRENVGIYWKELSAAEDYDAPSDFQKGWTAYPVSTTTSCYTSMVLDNNGDVAFLYEENSRMSGAIEASYDIMFKSFGLDDITGKTYSDEDLWAGKVLMIKGITYTDNNGVDKQRYLYNNNMTLVTSEHTAGTPTYNYYWVVSKDPGSDTYYLSSLNGDGYMGKGKGTNFVTGVEANNIPICTDDWTKEFDFEGFVKDFSSDITGVAMNGHALKFHDASESKSKVLAIANDNGEINWFNHSALHEKTGSTGRYWSTDFELTEVKYTDEIDAYGSFAEPTYFGFPVKFARSDDGKTKYNFEDYNMYATLKFPFAVTLPDDVKAYKCASLSSVSGTQVQLEELELKYNVLPRETPVLLMMPGSKGDGVTEKTIYLRPALAQKIIDNTGFNGTLGKKTFAKGEYNPDANHNIYILSKKEGHVAFYYLSNNTMAANKAYYVFDGVATNQSLVFNFGGTTAIDHITAPASNKEHTPVYDLAGRRVAAPAKGIYIRGNKKVIVR